MKATKSGMQDMLHSHSMSIRARNAINVDKDLAERDPNYFAEAVLGYEQARIHREMQEFWGKHRYGIARAPIGFGKSTQLLEVRTLFNLAGNQDATHLWNSSSMENLMFYIGAVQATLVQNRKLRAVWPHMQKETRKGWPTVWNKYAFMLMHSEAWMDKGTEDGQADLRPSVLAISTGSQKQGIRADYIFPDDPLDAMTCWSESIRENQKNWLNNTLISRQSFGRSTVQGIGTPHHLDDWCHDVVEHRGFAVKTWDGDDYRKLWPEREEHIKRMRVQLHAPSSEYDRLIKCKPASGTLELFEPEILRDCACECPYGIHNQEPEASRWPGYCGVDVAGTSKSKHSANTCFAPWIVTPDGVMRLVELRSKKGMNTEEKMRTFIEIHRTFPRMIFVVEDNNTQDFLSDLMRNAKFIEALGVKPEEIPAIIARIQTWTTTGERKQDPSIGIPAMDASFRAKRIEYRANGPTNKWINHLIRYTHESHPADDVMAAWIGWAWLHDRQPMSLSMEYLYGVKSDFKPLESTGGIGDFMPGELDSVIAEMMI